MDEGEKKLSTSYFLLLSFFSFFTDTENCTARKIYGPARVFVLFIVCFDFFSTSTPEISKTFPSF